MIFIGKNIRNKGDKLTPIALDMLVRQLTKPDNDTHVLIRQLRAVRDLDADKYLELKRRMPYFVCANFNPTVRKHENFAFIDYFIVDIDNLYEKGVSIEDVRKMAKKDNRVVLAFESTGQNGIKLMFRLSERCYDEGMYSLFYHAFVKSLSSHYKVDLVPSKWAAQVVYPCFLSMDSDLYYCKKAEAVKMSDYVDVEDTIGMFDMKSSVEHEKSFLSPSQDNMRREHYEPDDEAMDRIRRLLRSRKAQKPGHPVYVPEELIKIMESLRTFIEDQGLKIDSITDIQYGKKIRCHLNRREAEMNLFYGKRGFSAVLSPRTGTDPELNEMLVEIVKVFLEDIPKR